MNEEIKIKKIQSFQTKDGYFAPIWTANDDWSLNYIYAMIYVSTMSPGSTKGPIVHRERVGRIGATCGKIKILYKDNLDGLYRQLILCDTTKGEFNFIDIPKNVPYQILNYGETEGSIINFSSGFWDKEDNIKFESWEDYDSWIIWQQNRK